MNRALDFQLRIEVFRLRAAAELLLVDLEQRLAQADNAIDAESSRLSMRRVRNALNQLDRVA
jgi:hypothetical protein